MSATTTPWGPTRDPPPLPLLLVFPATLMRSLTSAPRRCSAQWSERSQTAALTAPIKWLQVEEPESAACM
uniref:Uncharacterized protein n=1 Tax=Knipowitschia caucasica TaxID=637954 RepID=A0AAV2K314_KNICA